MILFYHEFSPSLFNFASTGRFLLIPLLQYIGPSHRKGHQLQSHQSRVLLLVVKILNILILKILVKTQRYLSATGMLSSLPLQATELFTQSHPHSCIHIVQCLLWLPHTFIDKMFNKIASWLWFFSVDSYCHRKGGILIFF